jgi:hypothetical protein
MDGFWTASAEPKSQFEAIFTHPWPLDGMDDFLEGAKQSGRAVGVGQLKKIVFPYCTGTWLRREKNKLFNRPRKYLNNRTPAEVFWSKPKYCASD